MAPGAGRRRGLGSVVLAGEHDGRRAAGLTLAREQQDAQPRPGEPFRHELSTRALTSGRGHVPRRPPRVRSVR